MENLQQQITELEFLIELNSQLTNLKEVLDYYEKSEFPNNYSENEYFSFSQERYMSEAEVIKCANWIVDNDANTDTDNFQRLRNRLIKLNLIPKTKIRLNIGYIKAKERFNNLTAYKQLKNL